MFITYWGDVAKKLEAVNKILADSDVVADITVEELNYGACLIEDVFSKLTAAKQLISQRQN